GPAANTMRPAASAAAAIIEPSRSRRMPAFPLMVVDATPSRDLVLLEGTSPASHRVSFLTGFFGAVHRQLRHMPRTPTFCHANSFLDDRWRAGRRCARARQC